MATSKRKLELVDVVAKFGKQLFKDRQLSAWQIKALFDIMLCRTASLGGHEEACDCCATVRYSYNSCGNRHCPKCQWAKQVLWVDKLIRRTLPIKHYHVVFTVPHVLNKVCLWNDSLYYRILFQSVGHVLRSFGYTHYGIESGAVVVLHTWGQNLSLHPHVHCLIPAAGYALNGQWKNIGVNGKYLYPIGQLGAAFKAKFLDALKRALNKQGALNGFRSVIEQAYQRRWVVHAEPPMASAQHVVRYLGQYTHRVAIANKNLVSMSDTHVKFIAKDYRDNAKRKPASLPGVEFLRRFCQHILPKGFVKIRYYGIYNSTTKRSQQLQFNKATIEEYGQAQLSDNETAQECLKRVMGIDLSLCPVCKKGRMVKIRELPKIRSPNDHLPTVLYKLLK